MNDAERQPKLYKEQKLPFGSVQFFSDHGVVNLTSDGHIFTKAFQIAKDETERMTVCHTYKSSDGHVIYRLEVITSGHYQTIKYFVISPEDNSINCVGMMK